MLQASGYAWMYERMVAEATTWDGRLSIIAGGLGGLVGTGGLISTATSDGDPPLWTGVLSAVVGYTIALVLVLANTWKLVEVRSEGLVSQVGFAHLNRTILFQLALAPSEREDARNFVKKILAENETLKLSSPTISGRIRRAYTARFRDNPIYTADVEWDAFAYRPDTPPTPPPPPAAAAARPTLIRSELEKILAEYEARAARGARADERSPGSSATTEL
jgi:hypothetical protein